MIVDLDRFAAAERPHWEELEALLARVRPAEGDRLSLEEAQRLHYLYRRAASGLSRLGDAPANAGVAGYLADLVARAHMEIHESRKQVVLPAAWRWAARDAPRTVRRHAPALAISVALTLFGAVLGAALLVLDEDAKTAIMPFSHLHGDPSDRVAREEATLQDRLAGNRANFSAALMQNNIRVSLFAIALGATFAFGTFVLLFYNGVILGAVALDYVLAGETVFLLGWLLPHGSVEIPAIFLAGQAGLVIGHAMLGWGDALPFRARMRAIGPDVMTIIGLIVLLLVWAGIVESYFSQYHEPVLPYAAKIAFGGAQLALLIAYLALAGRKAEADA